MLSPLRGAYAQRGPDKTRVLVVEDESDIAGLVKHTLERGGDAIVDIASSGDQALKLASEQTPDLIILDLNLPVLGGLEVCRLLRTRPTTANTPIIMLTARTTESDRVQGLDAGADDYVTKPFSPRELAARASARCCAAARPKTPDHRRSIAVSTWWPTSTRSRSRSTASRFA